MQLNAKTTALVLIDLQKGVLARPVAPYPAATIHERSMQLAPRAKVDLPGNFGALAPGWDEFPQPLDPADVMVTKRQWGAFYGTDLDLQLRRRGVRTIVLGGIATSIGVESTARSAWEHGYELVICGDLCADLSAETHASSFKHIFPRLARIGSSQAITLE
jgi:nicotinamidase-related amidase